MHRESITKHTDTFRTSSVKHAEAYNPPQELRRNEQGLRFLYKLRSNTTYTESLNILDVIIYAA